MLKRELYELRGQVDSLAAVSHRMLEVEERVDFAERLLVRGDEASGTGEEAGA